MKTGNYWVGHFKINALQERIDWNVKPAITAEETATILRSLQAWQLGETSEGKHLIAVAEKYAANVSDPAYVEAIRFFIREEQKHGENLGLYLDAIGKQRIKKNWGDTLFRKVRYFNTSMEIWTLAVITVESAAQIFYLALHDATRCKLLKSICVDILIDEDHHITFQTERLATIFDSKPHLSKAGRKFIYKYFFVAVATLVWVAHRKVFKAGGNSFFTYLIQMQDKYRKTLKIISNQYAHYQTNITFMK